MKKITLLLVIIFTFLFSNTSWGDWDFVIKDPFIREFYYDKDRVRKSGKYLYVWVLTDFSKPNESSLSMTTYVQLDCSIFRYKMLKQTKYDGQMGEGEQRKDITSEGEWNYPKPNTSIESLVNKVCEEHQ